ncbi:MAG: thioesterase family protein [Solirubrobacteraceae bacterium]|nr:thioesterase family protein [Solirubrobacteraceae bacterium]
MADRHGPDDHLHAASPADPASDFAAATAVTALGDGRYGCFLDARWSALAGINGGILNAILIRAAEAEVGEGRSLRSLHVQFMRPPKATDAEVHVEVLRSGGRATNLRLSLHQGGRLILEALATCMTGGLRELARWSPTPPSVPSATDTQSPTMEDPRMPAIADRLTYGPRIGPPPLSGTPLEPGAPARTGGWLQLHGDQRIDAATLAFFADAWWPAALGPIDVLAFNPTVDLTFHLRTSLPPGGLDPQPILLDVRTEASLEGLVDEDARLYTADGTLLATSRQLAITLTPDDRPPVTRDNHALID